MLTSAYIRKKWRAHPHEPYFERLSLLFWFVNGGIVLMHFALTLWMYISFYGVSSGFFKTMMLFPLVSLFTLSGMAAIYHRPEYSNIPYSLLLTELPPKRQKDLQYIFRQIIVTSAGYFAVFLLAVQIQVIAVYLGIGTVFFSLIYACLAVLVFMKFVFASWFIVATREKRPTKRA